MAQADTIKEFLIGLGWKIDVAGERRFMDSVETATKRVAGLTVALGAAAVAAVASVQKIAAGFENLYFASSRLHSSVSSIKSFEYAISNLGGTVEGAHSTLEKFAEQFRENPRGMAERLRFFGVALRDAKGNLRDFTTVLDEVVHSQKFQSLPDFSQLRFARGFGFDDITYLAATNDKFKKLLEERRQIEKDVGVNPEQAAANAEKFMQTWRKALGYIEEIRNRVFGNFDNQIQEKIKEFIDYINRNGDKLAKGLIAIGNGLAAIVGWLTSLIIKVGEWAQSADPWIEKNLGIADGIEKISAAILLLALTRIPALILALGGLLLNPAFLAFMAFLAATGIVAAGAFNLGERLKSVLGGGGAGEGAGAAAGGGATPDDRTWLQKHLPKALGGKDAPSGGGGSLSANQIEAYAAARKEGLSETAAHALVANMTGESLANPADYHWDVKHMSQGIAQWDPQRSAAIAKQFGKEPRFMTVADQTKALIWEYRNNARFAETKSVMENDSSGEEKVSALVRNFEVPRNPGAQIARRMGYFNSLSGLERNRAAADKKLSALSNAAAIRLSRHTAGDQFDNRQHYDYSKPGHPLMAPAVPIGHASHDNSIRYGHHIHAPATITINAAGDPGATARAVSRELSTRDADNLRNLQGAAH